MERLTWNEYFSSVAETVSKRATCPRLSVGCVLVKENQIIATGYNGSIEGAEHCTDVGCLMNKGSCVRTIHAELNALLQCAKSGQSTLNSEAYVTHQPCYNCTKNLIQAGVKKIYYLTPYREEEETLKLIQNSGVSYQWLKKDKNGRKL